MQYKSFIKAGVKVSIFGLGCMRLPQDGGKIDRPHALRMMRTAIERGVNYFDTAYMYHGGESELVVAQALKEAGRDKVFVATKMPCSNVQTKDDLRRILDDQLKKLGCETIDFYLFHALSKSTWIKMQELDALDFLDRAVKDGKIRYPGFSHHDNTENFMEIIDAYPNWAAAQIILNYLDDQYQAGLSGSEYAAKKGVEIIVMEPLKGGMLISDVPESVSELFYEQNPDVTLAEWAHRWVYSIPQVSCILSGASSMQQLEENLDSFEKFSRFESACLTDSEKKLFENAKSEFLRVKGINCTACRYCLPCPSGVDIPGVLANYNLIKMFDNVGSARMRYGRLIYSGASADKCSGCGHCEAVCPQKLPVTEIFKTAHDAMK
jgi:predicted aldo/keto reductase-like oxidoreductase